MLPWNSNQRATRRFPTSHTMLQRAFLHRGIWFVSSDPESWLSSTSAHTTKIIKNWYDSSKICVASTTLLLPTSCGPQVLWQLTNWQRGQQISSAPAEYCTELKHHFISYAWEGGKGPRVQNNKTQHRLKMIWHDPADGFNMFKPLKEKIRNQDTNQWFKAPLCQSLRIWGAASVSFDMKISPCDMHICPFHQPKSPRTSVGRKHRAWGAADIRSGHFHNDEWGPLRPPWPLICHIWHGMDFSGLKFDPWTLPLNDLSTVHQQLDFRPRPLPRCLQQPRPSGKFVSVVRAGAAGSGDTGVNPQLWKCRQCTAQR